MTALNIRANASRPPHSKTALTYSRKVKSAPVSIWETSGSPIDKRASYCVAASIALAIHFICIWLIDLPAITAQTLATLVASLTMYAFKEVIAYRRRGSWRWYLGLPPFLLSGSPGAITGALFATWLINAGMSWPLASLCGGIISLSWNYRAADRHGWAS